MKRNASAPLSVCLLLLLIPILIPTLAFAQAGSTAQIAGTVKDDTGGVLPGVTITVTQTATSFTRTAVSDETGGYVLPNLPVGPYRLEATLQGFRSYVQTGIVSPSTRPPPSTWCWRSARSRNRFPCRPTRRWSRRGAPASAS